ncbi:hypothetical protein ACFYRG_33450 [Streptomyces mirabilis]|uniref:hypothetical protein n=1 Tax=Streptomyces mirabilis TaxID=68239 RepID=UPI0036C8DB4C
MTLFELQECLGHRTPEATTHYAKFTPSTLGQSAYNDAGCFAKNVRTTEVVVDRDAVASGAAASGEPWQYYGLGRCTTPSSSKASTAWPAHAATSTPRRNPANTPAGPTPSQIGAPVTATLLPVIDVTARTRSCRPGEPC